MRHFFPMANKIYGMVMANENWEKIILSPKNISALFGGARLKNITEYLEQDKNEDQSWTIWID